VSATFEQWVDAVFNHPVDKPEWYWNDAFDSFWEGLNMSDALTVSFLAHLFANSHELRKYSLPQVGQGIWFLVGESSPAQPAHCLLKPSIPLNERANCIRAITKFFRNFVAPSAPGRVDIKTDPFHIACYMWWDIFPTWGGSQAGEAEIHEACLEVMEQVLKLPSDLCQLSALHGLNHWLLHYEQDVLRIVDAYLQNSKNLSPRICEYAVSARNGQCQ
jgi:hypothetical protein